MPPKRVAARRQRPHQERYSAAVEKGPLRQRKVESTKEHGLKLGAGGEWKNCKRARNARMPEAEQSREYSLASVGAIISPQTASNPEGRGSSGNDKVQQEVMDEAVTHAGCGQHSTARSYGVVEVRKVVEGWEQLDATRAQRV